MKVCKEYKWIPLGEYESERFSIQLPFWRIYTFQTFMNQHTQSESQYKKKLQKLVWVRVSPVKDDEQASGAQRWGRAPRSSLEDPRANSLFPSRWQNFLYLQQMPYSLVSSTNSIFLPWWQLFLYLQQIVFHCRKVGSGFFTWICNGAGWLLLADRWNSTSAIFVIQFPLLSNFHGQTTSSSLIVIHVPSRQSSTTTERVVSIPPMKCEILF